MATLLASDRVTLLQQNFLVAVAADVLCGESSRRVQSGARIEGGCGSDIDFARHDVFRSSDRRLLSGGGVVSS